MKKNIIIISLFFGLTNYYCQNTYSLLNPNGGLRQDNATFNNINSLNTNKSLSYNEIKGSPYYDENFAAANFIGNNMNESAPARYDSYSDNIEFKKNNQVFALPKNNDITRIEFTNTKNILVKLDTSDDLSGYFFELIKGNNSLYKKVKTTFIDATVATSSYGNARSANFKQNEPIYYIKTSNGFIKNPKNLKDILKSFNNKEKEINTIFKSEKIKLNKEEDLIKLVNKLNEIS